VAERLLKPTEVAQHLNVSTRQVRRLHNRAVDPLPFVRVGGRSRRVNPTDLELWLLRQREVQRPPEPGLFAGFSDEARTALEGFFCAASAPEPGKTQAT
jgi:excisionase family DNA binding protein